jgi:hypothetical protein
MRIEGVPFACAKRHRSENFEEMTFERVVDLNHGDAARVESTLLGVEDSPECIVLHGLVTAA